MDEDQKKKNRNNKIVTVIVRCRPLTAEEIEGNVSKVITVDETNDLVHVIGKDGKHLTGYEFDSIYDARVENRSIYDKEIYSIVESVLNGNNATVFAYGPSGSGKTHTMSGCGIKQAKDSIGLIQMSLQTIFDYISAKQSDNSIVKLSYIEIYKEELRDLTNMNQQKLTIIGGNQNEVSVTGLKWHIVKNVKDCYEVKRLGDKNRAVAATRMNRHSSRSHTILTVMVCLFGAKRGSKLNLVDLAGSERYSAMESNELRFIESRNINLSLSALYRVIMSLLDSKATFIPYRQSKLTRLLQDSLNGKTKAIMITCVSPSETKREESLTALFYAYKTREIRASMQEHRQPTLMYPYTRDGRRRVPIKNSSKPKRIVTEEKKVNSEETNPKTVIKQEKAESIPQLEHNEAAVRQHEIQLQILEKINEKLQSTILDFAHNFVPWLKQSIKLDKYRLTNTVTENKSDGTENIQVETDKHEYTMQPKYLAHLYDSTKTTTNPLIVENELQLVDNGGNLYSLVGCCFDSNGETYLNTSNNYGEAKLFKLLREKTPLLLNEENTPFFLKTNTCNVSIIDMRMINGKLRLIGDRQNILVNFEVEEPYMLYMNKGCRQVKLVLKNEAHERMFVRRLENDTNGIKITYTLTYDHEEKTFLFKRFQRSLHANDQLYLILASNHDERIVDIQKKQNYFQFITCKDGIYEKWHVGYPTYLWISDNYRRRPFRIQSAGNESYDVYGTQVQCNTVKMFASDNKNNLKIFQCTMPDTDLKFECASSNILTNLKLKDDECEEWCIRDLFYFDKIVVLCLKDFDETNYNTRSNILPVERKSVLNDLIFVGENGINYKYVSDLSAVKNMCNIIITYNCNAETFECFALIDVMENGTHLKAIMLRTRKVESLKIVHGTYEIQLLDSRRFA